MRAILAVLIFLAMAASAQAAPFVICDPQTGVTFYKLTGPAWVPATVPAQADGSIKWDIAVASVGATTITAAACKTDAIWGEQCSAYSPPFTFTRPASPSLPALIRLIP